MLDLLRDPVWQFVGALLALITIASTIIMYLIQRQRKRLSYDVISTSQLLTIREELEGKLQVLYEGQPAHDIRLLVVKLMNSGNIAVSSSDYERPVSFETGPSSKILSAVVTEVDPQNLDADVTVGDGRVTLKPLLLNPADSVTMKILVSDCIKPITVDGRIIGVNKIGNVEKASGHYVLILSGCLILMLAATYLFFNSFQVTEARLAATNELLLGVVFLTLSYIGAGYTMWRARNIRRALSDTLKQLLDK